MIMLPKTTVDKFVHRNKALRYGQAFHQYMKLEKVTQPQDKVYCDRIYNEPNEEVVKAWIRSRLDYNN